MTETELRALVREAIARHLRPDQPPARTEGGAAPRMHVSHAHCTLPVGMASDGPCLIEPAVPCNHCGFCKSYGH